MKKLIAFICALAITVLAVYGYAKAKNESDASRGSALTASVSEEAAPAKSLLLCLPSGDNDAAAMLREAFEAQAAELGLTVYISQPAAGISDTEQWDLDQLQYNANGIAVFSEDAPDAGLLRKWSDAGKTTVVCGAALDPAAEAGSSKYGKLAAADVSVSQTQLSKAIAKYVTDTLDGENYTSGSIGIYTAPDGDAVLAASLQGDISLCTSSIYATGSTTSAADAEGYADEISAVYTQLSDIRAFILFGGSADVWAQAREGAGKTRLLTGSVGYSAAAISQLASGGLDFVAFCDYTQMGKTAADTLAALLSGSFTGDWSIPVAPALLTDAASAQAYTGAAQ